LSLGDPLENNVNDSVALIQDGHLLLKNINLLKWLKKSCLEI
jgi:hypothetical protein